MAEYLDGRGESDAEFAKRTGMNRTEVWYYRTGQRQPRATHLAAIEQATRGKVRAKDFAEAA